MTEDTTDESTDASHREPTDDAEESGPGATDGGTTANSGRTDFATDAGPGIDEQKLRRWLEYGAFGLLGLLALVATVGAYSSANAAIDVWIASAYKPLVRTAFNLVVLGCAGIGISLLARRRFDE